MIVAVILLVYMIVPVFDFFGIGLEVYINYLIWFVALAILWQVLPKEVGTQFDTNE
tara:strand:- start:11438 stop:11605 length:168 start_codon:yes stop_codon:yes gene_type:complete